MKSLPLALSVKGLSKTRKKYASGGLVKGGDFDESPVSIADEIRKREQGTPDDQVDLEANNAEDSPYDYEDMNELAGMDDLYDIDEEIEDQPEDSNLKGGSIADRIRKKK